MVIVSVLLISKIPTFSFKKISIKRNMTIFLLFGLGLYFVSIIQFTFETLSFSLITYLLLLPVGVYNFKLKSKSKIETEIDDQHQDVL